MPEPIVCGGIVADHVYNNIYIYVIQTLSSDHTNQFQLVLNKFHITDSLLPAQYLHKYLII